MQKPQFVYVTYIRSTPDKVWNAITDPAMTRRYWVGNENISDWKPGSEWKHQTPGGEKIHVAGKILESNPPNRLVVTWASPQDVANPAKTSRVEYDIQPAPIGVRLTVTHTDLDPEMEKAVSGGWPKVLSSLKSLLETGEAFDLSAMKCGCGD